MRKGTATIEVTDEDLAEVGEVLSADDSGDDEGDQPEMYRTFTDQPIALIGSPTSDGRMLSSDIELSFRSFPLPLMWCEQNTAGHDMSYTVGVIEDARIDGDHVLASGYLLNTEESDRAAYQNGHGVSNPSVDLAGTEWSYTDSDGKELDWDELWDLMDEGGEYFMTFTKAELIGTTLVSTPAFDTRLVLNTERETREIAIVASAAEEFRPRVYDHRLFENPRLSGPTLPTMGDDGRIYGHLAEWRTPHRSIQGRRQLAPKSPTQYSHFHTSPAVRLDNGESLPVGRLTVGTGHADDRLRAGPAMAHYDNTGSCFALVRVGEDKHGIWFSGVAAPWATAEQIEEGLSAPLSGDWRDLGQGLELIAALAVNTPGFPVSGREDSQGRPLALVASGRLSPRTKRGGVAALTKDDITNAVAAGVVKAFTAQQESKDAAERLAARDAALARAASITAPKTVRDRVGELLAKVR